MLLSEFFQITLTFFALGLLRVINFQASNRLAGVIICDYRLFCPFLKHLEMITVCKGKMADYQLESHKLLIYNYFFIEIKYLIVNEG